MEKNNLSDTPNGRLERERVFELVNRGTGNEEMREGLALAREILRGCEDPDVHHAAAMACHRLGMDDLADLHVEAAVRLAPDHQMARLFRAGRHLEYGRMEWWLEYDQWQFRIARAGAIGLTCPRWLGFDLDGRAIMLEAHGGGNGDAIMFIRFAPELKRRGAAGVLVVCPANLAGL